MGVTQQGRRSSSGGIERLDRRSRCWWSCGSDDELREDAPAPHRAHARASREHLDRLTWSAERLREERTARLRELIAVAKAPAWHRHRLKDVDPQKVDKDELHELPAMSKTDLMTHFDAIVTDPRVTSSMATRSRG